MPTNYIDLGALQAAKKQDLGATQGSGGTVVNETISLGVTAGTTPAAAALIPTTLSLGLTAGTADAAPIAVDDTLPLGVTMDMALIVGPTKNVDISADIQAGTAAADVVTSRPAIQLGVGAGIQVADTIHFGTARRGKTAVVVVAKFTGRSKVR